MTLTSPSAKYSSRPLTRMPVRDAVSVCDTLVRMAATVRIDGNSK